MTHPHAEILRAIADGVPLSEFEISAKLDRSNWENMGDGTGWGSWIHEPEKWLFRRKQRTHVVNGFTVPAPMDKEPEFGDMYFIPDVADEFFYAEAQWQKDSQDMRWLKLGLCFATKDAAIANAKAMLKIDPEAA